LADNISDEVKELAKRESIRIRSVQSVHAQLSFSIAAVVVGALLWRTVNSASLMAWLLPVVAATQLRGLICRKILDGIDAADSATLVRFENWLWATLVVNTTLMGLGIWWMSNEPLLENRFFVTLVLTFYSVGALVNTASHVKSFAVGALLNLGQAIAYWSFSEQGNAAVAVMLVVILQLLISSAKQLNQSFLQSLAMRWDNAALANQLTKEKAAVEQALEVAKEANMAKSRFLAAASHDLRQPLHAISLYVGTLSLTAKDQATRNIAEKLDTANRVLDRLFNNLLDLARFEIGSVKPQVSVFALTDLCAQLDTELRPLAERDKITLTISSPAIYLNTDAELLARVLRNYLHNAVKYTKAGQVSLDWLNVDGAWTAQVSDTGIGIAPENQSRIFDEFVQVGNTARDAKHGVGLGLSIVRRIADLMQWKVAVRSEIGKGSVFEVALPPHQVVPAPGVPSKQTVLAKDESLGLRVLLVDDDLMVQDALASQLGAWNCSVQVASNAEQARSMMLQNSSANFNVLIVDDMLGDGETGPEFATTVKDNHPEMPILVITGNMLPERREEIIGAGFDIMEKPVQSDRLLRWLRQVQ
jgi:two-component system, sensor histidine kinase